MQYRRKLRSRIIISFLLLGSGLTALFAFATIQLRERLESDLIGKALEENLRGYADSFYVDPSQQFFEFEKIVGYTYSARRFANVRMEWRDLPNGVHDLSEINAKGREASYKLAVRKDRDYWFFLRYDTTQERESQDQLQWALLVAVGGFSVLSFLLGLWSSQRVMRPVADLVRRVQAFGGEAQPEALAPHFADDEVGQLAAALDDYSMRLTELVKRDREFNADVSHELRTPLAVIRGAVELLLAQDDLDQRSRQRLLRIERACLQSIDLITALLTLSRNERLHGQTDIARLAEQLLEANLATQGRKPVSGRVIAHQAAIVNAPEAVLSVAIGNLVGNAFKYTAAGEVRIDVHADRIEIRDSGAGISAEEAERVFERGMRGRSAEGSHGAGIGLAVVSRLCELYGWQVRLAPEPQGGTLAELRFGR
ncbi:MAG: HAMP domain-containing sensor histidine kinase [Lysobacteraceae bacterium]